MTLWTEEEATPEQVDQWRRDACAEFVHEELWAASGLEMKKLSIRKVFAQGNDATAGSETVTVASTVSPGDPEGCEGECDESWFAWDDVGMAECLSAVKMAKGKGEVKAAEARIHRAEFDQARSEEEKPGAKNAFRKMQVNELSPNTQVIGSRFVLTWKEASATGCASSFPTK